MFFPRDFDITNNQHQILRRLRTFLLLFPTLGPILLDTEIKLVSNLQRVDGIILFGEHTHRVIILNEFIQPVPLYFNEKEVLETIFT